MTWRDGLAQYGFVLTVTNERSAPPDMLRILGAALSVLALAGCTGPQHVSFPTEDGGVVHADVYGDGDRGVVLAHGGRFTKESWETQAHTLAEAGFRVVAIDFRGRGQSRGGPRWNALDARDDGVQFDVLAAVRFLHQAGSKSVSVVGASFGGWAAGRAAVEAPCGPTVVAIRPEFSNFHLRTLLDNGIVFSTNLWEGPTYASSVAGVVCFAADRRVDNNALWSRERRGAGRLRGWDAGGPEGLDDRGAAGADLAGPS